MTSQPELPLKTWGGRRRGAGRPRLGSRPTVAHRTRAPLASRFPVHVTIRLRDGLPSLRAHKVAALVLRCLSAMVGRFPARIVHYGIQGNHLHLLLEAADRRALGQAAKSLSIRIAKGLNRLLGSRGQVVPHRYDARILKTPLQVKRALVYVLGNARKHMAQRGVRILWDVDPHSSARVFDGWARPIDRSGPAPPVEPPRTWLLAVGWRRHGLLPPGAAPA